MQVAGKVVVVTGGGNGIGKAMCEAFHRAGAAKVVVVDLDHAAAEAVATSIGGAAFKCDVGQEKNILHVIEETEKMFGPIALFCSNAGIGGGFDPLSVNAGGASDEPWARSWAIHVMAHVYAARHLILPTIVLGTIPLAVIARMTRSSMLEVLREDYVRTARAKGLSPARVVFIHTLRNALIPVLTVIGLQVGTLMGGAVLTETIFSWPGIGKWLIDAIGRRDYPVVQSGILLVATLVIVTNFVVDILYGVANPRIRHNT